ncbi:MAG: efflux RND transporter periplasmic adaptor subunit [Chloroflexi bacterium]|nr:efflux RND transporter periplasmic adaptor subunit [Chloroflexota bacterium]
MLSIASRWFDVCCKKGAGGVDSIPGVEFHTLFKDGTMKERLSKISRRTWIILGVVAAVVAVVAYMIFGRGRGNTDTQYTTEKLKRGTLTATVGATGTVRAQQSAVLTWETNGTVEKVDVKVGDQVQQDQVLATLQKISLPQNIIAAEADLINAQQTLDDLLASDTARAQAAITLRKAQDNYDTAKSYRESLNEKIDLKKVTYIFIAGRRIPQVKYYKGYADPETIAKADEDLALKKAQLDDAQREYDRLKDGPNSADVAAAQARVDAAQATLNMARIAAPFAGTVTQAEPLPGDQVSAGTTAFRVDDLSHFLVDVQISEVDINSVSVGQQVTLTFDAILNKTYNGKVVEVGQAGNSVQGVVSFDVTIELTDPDPAVKPGMTAGINIVVTELKDVLMIPNRAVRVVDNKRVVYVLRNGQPVMVGIRLGQSSDNYSALADGDLKEGDLIILNPPTTFGPGGPGGGGGPF